MRRTLVKRSAVVDACGARDVAGVIAASLSSSRSRPPAMLDACVASVLAAGDADRVIVVDNGGRAIGRVAAVELVRPRRNLGFGGGANVGFRRALELGATASRCSTTTSRSSAGWLRAVAGRAGQRSDAGCRAAQAAVRRIRAAAGQQRGRRRRPRRRRHRHRLRMSSTGRRFARHATDRVVHRWSGAVPLAFLDATAWLRRVVLPVLRRRRPGPPRRRLGWPYRCVPASVVWHRVSASTAQLGDRARVSPGAQSTAVRLPLRRSARMVRRALWLSIRRLRWTPRRVHARALAAGLALAPGRWSPAAHPPQLTAPARAPFADQARSEARCVSTLCDDFLKSSSVVRRCVPVAAHWSLKSGPAPLRYPQ